MPHNLRWPGEVFAPLFVPTKFFGAFWLGSRALEVKHLVELMILLSVVLFHQINTQDWVGVAGSVWQLAQYVLWLVDGIRHSIPAAHVSKLISQ